MTTAPAAPRLTPLEMALNLAATVQPIAEAVDRDPVQAVVLHLGEKGHAAGELAAHLALVSIAQDLHAIRRVMLGHADRPPATAPDGEPDPGWPPQ